MRGHTALIDVSSYPAETPVLSFSRRAVCGPNWKEQARNRARPENNGGDARPLETAGVVVAFLINVGRIH
jgi:hypothetical protein